MGTKIRTITEVSKKTGDFNISVFLDDSNAPSIFKSQILTEPKIIDNVEGKEGELFLSSDNEDNGELIQGELFISSDESENYQRGGVDNDLLIYVE
jgi:hypothetical protein